MKIRLRKIPVIMATQHPDNASKPSFLSSPFVSIHDEIEELYQAFSGLGVDEYMWDWEGKYADEAVIEKLVQHHLAYFKKHQLGKDLFLTYRIPNIWEERGFRLARAFMSMLTAEDLMSELKLHAPPILEVILPMTKRASQLIEIKSLYLKTEHLKKQVFQGSQSSHSLQIIPLFEEVPDLLGAADVLQQYVSMHEKKFGVRPPYLRPFLARSDPALNSGFVAATLAIKKALSDFKKLETRLKIPIFPMLGPGSLPFRGGLNPENVEHVIPNFAGVRTITVQSAFRYDYPAEQVKHAISYIKKTLPKLRPKLLSSQEEKNVKVLTDMCARTFRKRVEALAPLINQLAAYIPKRRERMLHIGLFGYARGTKKVSLPRAIGFTAVLYSLGIPPEFLGLGEALKHAKRKGLLNTVHKLFPTLEHEITHAGKYLNRENLTLLSHAMPRLPFQKILKDIEWTEDVLGVELGPKKRHHFLHRNLTSNIYWLLEDSLRARTDIPKTLVPELTENIVQAAVLRKSLG